MKITFINPWFLLGLWTLLIPFILHLFYRTRYRSVQWGGMIFLRRAIRTHRSRIQFENWLVLCNRSLILLFLVLTLSRPIITTSRSSPSNYLSSEKVLPSTEHVFILDVSASSQIQKENQKLFHISKNLVTNILDRIAPGDTCKIILAGRYPRLLLNSPGTNINSIRQELFLLEPTYESGNIPEAILFALHLLHDSKHPIQRVYLVADPQRSSWRLEDSTVWSMIKEAISKLSIPPKIYFLPVLFPLGAEENLSIISISTSDPLVDIFRETFFTVRIRNTGRAKIIRVNCFIDGILRSEQELLMNSGENLLTFSYNFPEPGIHTVQVEIEDGVFALDNSRSLAVRVSGPLPILLSEPKRDFSPSGGGSNFLTTALQIGALPQQSLFQVTRIHHLQLDQMDLGELQQYYAIFLVDPPSLSSLCQSRLLTYLRQGGGILLLAGRRLNPTLFKFQEVSDLSESALPCSFQEIISANAPFLPLKFPRETKMLPDQDLLPTNLIPESDLGTVQIFRLWQLIPNPQSFILLYAGEYPFLVGKKYGSGLFFVSANPWAETWSNLPYTNVFLPLTQHIGMILARRTYPPINLTIGDPIFFVSSQEKLSSNEDSEFLAPTCKIVFPDGKEAPFPITFSENRWVGQYSNTSLPGLYHVFHQRNRLCTYAVNIAPEEGELDSLSIQDYKKLNLYSILTMQNSEELIHLIQSEVAPWEIWRYSLLLVIILLMVELFLSWRLSG